MPVPPAGQVTPPDVLATHSAWVKAQKENTGLVLTTMDPDIQNNLEHLGAFDLLKKLKTLYVQQADQGLLQTIREFHACKQEERQGSRKLKSGALSLYMGDGHRATVKAIGEFHLNNLIYFNAVPRDDIYKIVLSSSNTNDSSIKKRIEKLQHDGLLDSTDIKSFEKCASSMCRKKASKPYSHQMKRARDLLGLIHTNVCGPFKIMSRQGAYYFVTFTDDSSHYGYVYLLKHKHEVFETFKVFQKEVENQLGNTIKSLRSDRGGYPKETIGYSFYYPPENKVFVARNAEFFENDIIDQEASGSLEDLEIFQEEDTHPSVDTSLNHEEDDQEINEPQSDINPLRRSTRTRRAPDRMCLYIDAEEHELGDLDFIWKIPKRETIPMQEKIKFSKSQGASTPAEIQRMQNIPYASAVGSIIGDTKRELRVSCYTDAGYLMDADDMKSQTGYVFVLNREAVWIRKFISGLGVVPTIEELINMYCDSIRATSIAKDHGVTKGARYFRAKVYYLRETMEMGDVRIEKVDAYDNLAFYKGFSIS
uniref:Retrotransposon protein, putative, Ty1-copia subclass n=1 Tax=Tanacetum cinerariifolium TaxID=118510 RepID=A0A6L2N9K0_TANCI|nr:hypothetical protein [Tanacetum cinerariifolium]